MEIGRIVLGLVVIVFSVIFHEIMHGWTALKMGDPTARDDGRLTLNPIPHIDPWMTVLFPVLCLLSTGGTFFFGGAKPVRINPFNFRNPGLGMLVSAAAGPLSNFFLAAASFGLMLALFKLSPSLLFDAGARQLTYNGLFLAMMIFTNVILGAFNLIPIPPLDGSRVLRYLLPPAGQVALDRTERFGILIILGLLFIGVIGYFLVPFQILIELAIWGAFGQDFYSAFAKGLYER